MLNVSATYAFKKESTMRIIFSRKGFDSAAGKAPSPIMEGEPISLPIPTERRSETSYRLAGIREIVEHVTKRASVPTICATKILCS
jgi:hypothetical protein